MTPAWTAAEQAELVSLRELQIAAPRTDGGPGRWVPVWVVVTGTEAFVRTWQRRTTGWYGRAVASGRAVIRLGGGEVEVTTTLVGDADAEAVDAAYLAKYGGRGGGSMMVTDESRLSTLRLDPVEHV